MPLYAGSQPVARLYRGGTPIARAYQGATLVHDTAAMEENYQAILAALGLHANAEIVLDFGSFATYPGSGQNVTDLTPNALGFFLGATNGAEASDPAFNGTAGAHSASEFLSVDGGDFLTLGAANPATINNLHKNNAVGTLIWWLRAETGANQGLVGTNGGSGSNVGINARINAAGTVLFQASNGGGDALSVSSSSVTVPDAQWCMLGVSWDEAAGPGGGRFYRNGVAKATETFNATYASPSASNATHPLQLLSRGNNVQPMTSGGRLSGFVLIEGAAFSEADFDAFFNATKARFGF
jgi:hypothetical protein